MVSISFDISRLLLSLLAVALLVACERSADVGWANREGREAAPQGDTAASGASNGSAPEAASNWARGDEYERLGRSLSSVLRSAREEEEMRERHAALVAEVEDAVAEKSSFYRGLMDRKEEIEARFAEVEESGEPLSDEERAKLLYQYRNINYEIMRIVEYELQAGDFRDEFWEYKLTVFERMRELAPARIDDIDRLQELERDRPVQIAPPLQENLQIQPATPEQ
ncbi:MAG: hypothetical protein GWN51_00515 [Gemmatimonadetes bacterium]|nr:hypothetical protein [Gemmatimonadota bacterium]NIV22138.1 hypothetical protein [Gemmatimonadota bacterium]NIY42260.1 hypothetical protein [Gemmatimonadota bacterium]